MKTVKFLSCACLFVAIVGCTNRSNPGGGAQKSATFTIDGPKMATSIKQGDTQTVELKINRGTDFRQAVKLKAVPPPGIDVVLSDSAITPTDKSDVNLKVAVGNNASPGEHIIQVTGTPDQGNVSTLELKVKVTEANATGSNKDGSNKDGTKLTLRGPGVTTLKQGESKTVKISMDAEPKYLVPVKLHVDPPKGIQAELTNDSLKAADGADTQMRITANKDAAVGDHVIRVTGKGDAANVTPIDVKVKVVAP